MLLLTTLHSKPINLIYGVTTRSIDKNSIDKELIDLIGEKHPTDEDIGILDENGEIFAAVITKEAYQFFLRKVEEAEDEIDNKTISEFHSSGEKEND